MKTKNSKDRAAGAIMGALIGDALGVGPHWYYDLDQLKQEYGEWINDYTAPKPDRFHAGLKAGESSQTGQVVCLLLESVIARGNYNEADFCERLDGLLATLDGTPEGGRYTDVAMRDVWHARQSGKKWDRAGSFANTAEAAIRTVVLAARYHNDFKTLLESCRSNIRLTHRDPFIAGCSVAFGLIVAALINGNTLEAAGKTISEQAEAKGLSLSVSLPQTLAAERREISFYDAVLQANWSYQAAKDDAVQINPPWTACRLFGLACPLNFMLPAAYYFNSRFENDFELPVLSAINGGGNNMARASLTGALSGAQVGLSNIPQRFITGLAERTRLLELATRVAEAAEA
ncbi:MAG: ADP-ribosylglycohydrolase family protein [Deltaproteobacteria bacterium]|jgi:ADP-ribosyl-[dinitrogen reductase] hydrolase